MNPSRLIIRRTCGQLRQFHTCFLRCQEAAAAAVAQEKIAMPVPNTVSKPVAPKIDKLAQEITALNLVEVAELSELLKKRLNLPDAPIMPAGGFAMSKPAEEEDAPVKAVKTSFNVKLNKFDETQKIALIKEIKTVIPGTNLVQAKKFVESLPQVVKADLSKDEAESLLQALKKVGGEGVIE